MNAGHPADHGNVLAPPQGDRALAGGGDTRMGQVQASHATDVRMDALDRQLLNALQAGLPICERPFHMLAEGLRIPEEELVERLRRLLQSRLLTRFGPLYNVDRMGGAYILAAMAVPEEDFDRVAAFVNLQPEIAHNYRREHRLNMWFVVAAESPAKADGVCRYLEDMTGLAVFRFPKEREYFVQLRLAV